MYKVFLFFTASLVSGSYAQENWIARDFHPHVFVKNVGQFANDGGVEVLFAAKIGTTDFFFTKNGYSAVADVHYELEEEKERFEKAEHGEPVKPREKRTWRVDFSGADATATLVADLEQTFTINYGDSTGSKTFVGPAFGRICYKNIYPGTDIEFTLSGDNGIKYDIILHPGADPDRVRLRYSESTTITAQSDTQLKLSDSFFEFSESIPSSFIQETGEKLDVSYVVSGNEVGFKVPTAMPGETIVIDPWLIIDAPFSTLDDFYKIDFDMFGNVWAIGQHGKELAKFDNTGTLQWIYSFVAPGMADLHGDVEVIYNSGHAFFVPGQAGYTLVEPTGISWWGHSMIGLANELWRVEHDEINDKLLFGKGGSYEGLLMGMSGTSWMSSGDLEIEVLPPTGADVSDVVMTELDPDGTKIYFVIASHIGPGPEIYSGYGNCLVTASVDGFTSPTFFQTGHSFMEAGNANYSDYVTAFPKPNTYNGIAVDEFFIYTYDALYIKKWDKFAGTIVDSVITGHPVMSSAGIAVDVCGNIYVGTEDSVVIYDEEMNNVGGYEMPGTVIDIRLNDSLMYICGMGFLMEMDFIPYFAPPEVTHTNEICDDNSGTAICDTAICPEFTFESLLWSPCGQTSATATGLSEGWQYLIVKYLYDSDTITIIDSVEILNMTAPITCDELSTQESCAGFNDGSITLTPTSGLPPYDFDIGTASNSTGIFTGLSPGVYTISVTDGSGCPYLSTITILAGTAVTATVDYSDELCAHMNDGAITVTTLSGISPFLFDIGVSSNTTGIFSGLDEGSYTITVTDDSGCTFIQTITLASGAEINLTPTLLNDPTCFGFTDGSATVDLVGGTAPYEYTWSPPNPILGATHNNLGGGSTVTVVVEDANGCKDTLWINLNNPPPLSADLTLFMPVCNGDQNGYAVVDTVYNAQGDLGNITYLWNPDPAGVSGLGADSTYDLDAGSYTLTINDDLGCTTVLTFEMVDPAELIFAEIGTEPSYCRTFPYQSGNGVVFAAASGGTPDYVYQWKNLSTGETSVSTTWGGLNPACYEISVTDDAGCILTQIICVDSLNPTADFAVTSAELNGVLEGTATVCAEFTNQSLYFSDPQDPLADTTFFWNFNNPDGPWLISHRYSDVFDTCYAVAGEYEVCLVVLNQNGCKDTACKIINVFNPLIIEPVNIITPNGDGVNDVFTFINVSKGVKEFHCVIINRWGQKLAEINDISAGWDAKDFSGSRCGDGVYFYSYEGKAENSEPFTGQGTIQIVGSGGN